MRKRLLEKSLYLSKEEKRLLQEKYKSLILNQSECIRVLINTYEPEKYDGVFLKSIIMN